MKRWMFLAVGIALLSATSASASSWKSVDSRNHKRERSQIIRNERPPSTSPIPEPTAALVFGTALLVIGVSKRRSSDR